MIGTKGIDFPLIVHQHNIMASVGQHDQRRVSAAGRNAAHGNTVFQADIAGSQANVQGICYDPGVFAQYLVEISLLIEYDGPVLLFSDTCIVLPQSVAGLLLLRLLRRNRKHGHILRFRDGHLRRSGNLQNPLPDCIGESGVIEGHAAVLIDMGDGFVVAVFDLQTVPYREAVPHMTVAEIVLLLWVFDGLEVTVVHGILRDHTVEVLVRVFLLHHRKLRIRQDSLLRTEEYDLILPRSDPHGISGIDAVLFLRRGRRIEIRVGGFQPEGQWTGKPIHEVFGPIHIRGYALINDDLQSFPHGRKNEISSRIADIGFLFSDRKGRCTGCQYPAIRQRIFRTHIPQIILKAVRNSLELIGDPGPFSAGHLAAQIVRVGGHLRTVQIAVSGDEFPDALFHLRPCEHHGVRGVAGADAAFQCDALAVVILPYVRTGNGIGAAADAVFVLEELHIVFGTFAQLKLLIDTELALRNAAAACQHIVDGCLRKHKCVVLISLCRFNEGQLLSLGGKRALIRIQPFVHQDHSIDRSCNGFPVHEDLHLAAEIGPAPHGQNIVPGAVANTLAVGEDLLYIGAVKEGLNIIAAFLAVLMVGKVRGNRHSMVFQGIADAEKFLLFGTVIIVRNRASSIKVVSAGLKDFCDLVGLLCGVFAQA